MYKNIDITIDQLSTTVVALRDMIKKNEDYIVFFEEYSSNINDLKTDRYVKNARQAVENCKEVIKALKSAELTNNKTL